MARSLAVSLALLLTSIPAAAQISTFPFFEDFENGPGGFFETGSNSSWERALTSKPTPGVSGRSS